MTAPISNEPTTTRLHHYAGRYFISRLGADGSEQGEFCPACGVGGIEMKEKPPLREGWGRAVKYSSPWHAEKCCILLILSDQGRYFFHDGSEPSGGLPCWGGVSFMEARWKW